MKNFLFIFFNYSSISSSIVSRSCWPSVWNDILLTFSFKSLYLLFNLNKQTIIIITKIIKTIIPIIAKIKYNRYLLRIVLNQESFDSVKLLYLILSFSFLFINKLLLIFSFVLDIKLVFIWISDDFDIVKTNKNKKII